MTGRLDRLLASCALISRTEAQSALRAGQVTVDGIVCRDGAGKYDTEKNVILRNGQRVEGDGFVYLMLNKPVGVLSATEDKKGETTALDLLPEPYQKAGPGVVGRLDKDAHGLLFLTSNGQLNHRLTSPRRHADKVYRVALDAPAGADLSRHPAGGEVPPDQADVRPPGQNGGGSAAPFHRSADAGPGPGAGGFPPAHGGGDPDTFDRGGHDVEKLPKKTEISC